MFAGAAREAVFSNAEVIKRVNADFIPAALKADLVNHPPDDEEGRLYREIGRSKPEPQGICVVNSAGKVLDWTLMFDDVPSMLAFFDHAKERFAAHPDARNPVSAEVFERFPSHRREDVADGGAVLPVLDRHPAGTHRPAEPPRRVGTVAVRVFGRALDHDGKPEADVLRQENYIEDRFEITPRTQASLAEALAQAARGPVKLPLELTRQWVKQAYMGMLDVQPLDNPNPSRNPADHGELKKCAFEATKVGSGKESKLWRVEGESEAFIDERMANGGPGDVNEVKLKWRGYIEMEGDRATRLVLSADGSETLRFQSARVGDHELVASLLGGRRVDRACRVRFGFLGAPLSADQTTVDAPEPAADEPGRRIAEALGPAFLVFRGRVQEELRPSADQKQKLDQRLQELVREHGPFFQKLAAENPEQREKKLQARREQARKQLSAFLEKTLNVEQLQRLRQVTLQQEGPFALGRPEVRKELKITDEQVKRFMVVVQEMQKEIEPLMKEAQSGGDPREIRPKVIKIRKAHEARMEAALSDAQRKQWKEMLGEPVDVLDD